MDITQLNSWKQDAADLKREEEKRWYSPSSFFFSQGKAIILAASYFHDQRLINRARGGVARKHRHRSYLALFGQLMASLEYLLKDFVAQVIDLTDIYDDRVKRAKWISVEVAQILTTRRTMYAWPGAVLFHSSLGWHEPRSVNARYTELFEYQPIDSAEVTELEQLWILRHSVAHNAGFVTTADAVRGGMAQLSNRVVDIDETFLNDTFAFLCVIARRVAEGVGGRVLLTYLQSKRDAGSDYARDKWSYSNLKRLSFYVPSRAAKLPTVAKRDYTADFAAANPPNAIV